MSSCQAGTTEAPPTLLPGATLHMVVADPQRLLAANAAWLPLPLKQPPSMQTMGPEVCPGSCRTLMHCAEVGALMCSVTNSKACDVQKRKFEEAFATPADAPQPPASPAKRPVSLAGMARASSSISFSAASDSARPAKSGTVSSAGLTGYGGVRDSASSQPSRSTPVAPVRKVCQECGTCNTPQWRTFRASPEPPAQT